jgi:hypothetical protein
MSIIHTKLIIRGGGEPKIYTINAPIIIDCWTITLFKPGLFRYEPNIRVLELVDRINLRLIDEKS